MARARLIKRGSRAKLSGASRARSHVRALVRSRGRRRRETRRRRGTRAARSEAVCDVVGASRARVRFPATTPGRPDDERAIQAAASRVVDITPWVLPLLLTVIVYAKQPSPSPLPHLSPVRPIIFPALLAAPSLSSSLASSRGFSFLALVSPPFPSTGSGPFVSPAWSAISIHSFPPPPTPCAKDVFSPLSPYIPSLAVFPPVPRSEPGTSRGVLSPSGYPSP